MTKLLTEQELEGKIAIILGSQYQRTELGALTLTEQIKEWSDLIQSQKQAHADMVIGHDDRHHNGSMMINDPADCMDCSNPDERFARNQLRAEQRERSAL